MPLVGQGIQRADGDGHPKSLAPVGMPTHGRKPSVQETAKDIVLEEMDNFIKACK